MKQKNGWVIFFGLGLDLLCSFDLCSLEAPWGRPRVVHPHGINDDPVWVLVGLSSRGPPEDLHFFYRLELLLSPFGQVGI